MNPQDYQPTKAEILSSHLPAEIQVWFLQRYNHLAHDSGPLCLGIRTSLQRFTRAQRLAIITVYTRLLEATGGRLWQELPIKWQQQMRILQFFFIDIDNYPSFTIAKIETVNPR